MANPNPLLNAKAELEILLRQQAEIERRIAAVRQSITILEPVYGGPSKAEVQADILELLELVVGDAGLTERVRQILGEHFPEYLSPIEMRDILLRTGFSAEGRSNFLSEIHNTLKRLKIRGIVEDESFPDGKRYRAKIRPRGALGETIMRGRRA